MPVRSAAVTRICLLGLLRLSLLMTNSVVAFSSLPQQHLCRFRPSVSHSHPLSPTNENVRGGTTTTTKLDLVNPALASVLAGSLAGAIGVGVAFPLDTLKTKSQILGQQQQQQQSLGQPKREEKFVTGEDGSVALEQPGKNNNLGLVQLVKLILVTEGVAGFFGGVRGMMIGQALIKAVAFSANAAALQALQPCAMTSVVSLILAACFSGFVTSFLVAPVERVKVMMQASSQYAHELECLKAVVDTEGWEGLFGRGLGPTLAREVPSYGIYFVVYGLFMQTPAATLLGPTAPLLFGALSGCACWIPVYPVDVVKVSSIII
jgi:solute carrier family 25 carnitine/acylcarnitine transporter 20/29